MSLFGVSLPPLRRIGYRAVNALVVGVTYTLLGDRLVLAAATAALFFALTVAGDTAEVVIGDYAGNAALGLLILAFAGVFLRSWLPGLLGGLLVGGWLVFDGVQHLRFGETRDEVGVAYSHDGGPLTGLPRALSARLLEPFRL